MRLVLPLLLLAAGCSHVFGLDPPELRHDGATVDNGADIDASVDAQGDDSKILFTVTFQQGLDNYTGATDTYISGGTPNANYNTDSVLRWKDTNRWALLVFDGLFGTDGIPSNATIVSAQLTLFIQNPTDGTITDVAIPWTSAVTYNTFGAAAGVDAGDLGATGPAVPQMTGSVSLDVKASVVRWAGGQTNYGWCIVPIAGGGGNDGTIPSSESATQATRPKLVVQYE